MTGRQPFQLQAIGDEVKGPAVLLGVTGNITNHSVAVCGEVRCVDPANGKVLALERISRCPRLGVVVRGDINKTFDQPIHCPNGLRLDCWSGTVSPPTFYGYTTEEW